MLHRRALLSRTHEEHGDSTDQHTTLKLFFAGDCGNDANPTGIRSVRSGPLASSREDPRSDERSHTGLLRLRKGLQRCVCAPFHPGRVIVFLDTTGATNPQLYDYYEVRLFFCSGLFSLELGACTKRRGRLLFCDNKAHRILCAPRIFLSRTLRCLECVFGRAVNAQ